MTCILQYIFELYRDTRALAPSSQCLPMSLQGRYLLLLRLTHEGLRTKERVHARVNEENSSWCSSTKYYMMLSGRFGELLS